MTIHLGPSTPPDHADPRSRVDGSARFTTDIPARGALHAAFVVSPESHARISRIDASEALALPGVVAVITGEDVGERRFGRRVRDYPVLALERVLFAGQRVAAVAAWDQQTARTAADLIDVDYELLEVVRDPERALEADAPVLHPDYEGYIGAHAQRSHPNVQGEDEVSDGDVEPAFRSAEDVYDNRFSWPRIHAAPLEPHACLVAAGDSEVHVYSSHKEPYKLRRDIALIAGRAETDVVVHPVNIGGDFGSKGVPYVEGACYLLSEITGRPVRTTMTYFEELTSTGARHPGWMRLRTAVGSDGFRAHETEVLFDGGAFVGLKPQPRTVVSSLGIPVGTYRPANRYERVRSVYTNNLPGAQVRSPGEFQATFAGESHVDMIARARGIDPLSFRLQHAKVPQAIKVLEALREPVAEWRSTLGDDAGIGVSVFHRGSGAGHSTVRIHADEDGIDVSVAAPDQGAGSYLVFRNLVAETLRVPADRVRIVSRGADPNLVDAGAGASRVTTIAGRACVEACSALFGELGAVPDDPPRWWVPEYLEQQQRGSVDVEGTWQVERGATGSVAPTHGALAVQVSVDGETGVLTIDRALLTADAGQVINPVGHRGQLEGGFVYGLGQTLFEHLMVEDGQVVTASLGDYKLASASDVPPLEIVVLPPDEGEDPLQAIRPVGELANLGVAPAVANAIDDAVGVRITSLPITADRILEGLERVGR